ncbi:small GTP-binding protein [Tritrichomonas foetus]|uniref:Ras-related protein Rab-7b n=1 Tax=Tritrichomonas foetus TaxID=1144522 RepID=A0A1J4L0Q4_9EUKA|nr:small GTP-binding protein [Tritrichomonas foetus]|eukprot:OHT17105.1 small GTP-binding protein [Tritrichomonas foetus]
MTERVCKLIVLGDSGVGKTTLIHQFVNQEFRADFKSTIGADFSSKTCFVGKKQVQLQIWDTAGEERFHSIGPTFFRGTDSCILVYDRTNRSSLEHLEKWKNDLVTNVENASSPSFPFVIFANKSDLESEEVVLKTEAEEMFKTTDGNHYPVFEVSAKTGNNIEEGFLKLSELYVKYSQESVHTISLSGVDLTEENNQKKNGKCC